MELDELYEGLEVKITDWSESGERPDHWVAQMDEWIGETVTISKVSTIGRSNSIFIEEDQQEWQWYPWDFEPYEHLATDNPNIMYRAHKQEKRTAERTAQIKKMMQETKPWK